MRAKTRMPSAKGLLTSLMATAPQQPQPADPQSAQEREDTEQPAEQNGNDSLPSEEEDEEQFDDEDDFEEEEVEEEAEPTFTDADKSDLRVLEGKVKHHGLEQAKAIREIRNRKLWMLHRGDDGQRKYRTYDEYVQEVHGRSRQWATEQTQWLTTNEKLADLRAQGKGVPETLTRNAVSGMHHLPECGNYQGETEDEQEEAGLVAVLQEAAEDGTSLSGDKLRAICNRRYQFFSRYKWRPKPLAASYDDYKKDLELVEPLSKVDRSERNHAKVKEWAETNNAAMHDAVVATYKQNGSLPDNDFLLSVATGDELEKMVADLVALGEKIASMQEAERVAKESREKARQTRESLGLPPKKKKGGTPPTPDSTNVSVDTDEDELDEGESNDVQENVDTALDYLDAALEAEWPDSEEGEMIQAILDSAQSCEAKLAEITNKAKELLAEVAEPVKVHDPYFPDE